MTGLGTIEERLAQALGSAHAGIRAARAARAAVRDPAADAALLRIETESRELAARCEAAVAARCADPVPVRRVARAATRTAATMMSGYLGPDPSPAVALEYLCLAKAGEVGRWVLLGAIADGMRDPVVAPLARWALPLLQEQLAVARRCGDQHPDPAGVLPLG